MKLFPGRAAPATLALLGFAVLGLATDSQAAFKLRATQTDGVATLLVQDGMAGDDDGMVNGEIVIGGITPIVFGDFTVRGSFSSSNRMFGPQPFAQLTSASTEVRNTTSAAHSILLEITDTDFDFPTPPPLTLESTAAGAFQINPVPPSAANVSGNSVDVETYADAGNAEFGMGFQDQDFVFATGTTNATNTGYSNDSSTGGFDPGPDGLYSLYIRFEFTVAGGNRLIGRENGITVSSAVPEPGTMAMASLALPLLGLGYLRQRRNRPS